MAHFTLKNSETGHQAHITLSGIPPSKIVVAEHQPSPDVINITTPQGRIRLDLLTDGGQMIGVVSTFNHGTQFSRLTPENSPITLSTNPKIRLSLGYSA